MNTKVQNIPAIPAFSTTSIGSVPFKNLDETLNLLAETVDIPAWPQMVKLSPWEDMLFGALTGLPALEVDIKNRKVVAKAQDREDDLTSFYEKFFTGDYQFLAPTQEGARGFYAQLEKAKTNPNFGPSHLKGQVIGPVTLGQSITVRGEKNLLDDPDLFDAFIKAVGAKGALMAAEIRALGRTPVIFLDEPGLTGYGSAFSTLSPETVLRALSEAADLVRSQGPALVGVHVCGNTDWGLLTQAGLDIINFDAYSFIEPFGLYPKELKGFYEQGGYVAWGIVPTNEFSAKTTAPMLADHLFAAWRALEAKGLDMGLIAKRSILSSACGLGSLSEDTAQAILKTMKPVAEALKKLV